MKKFPKPAYADLFDNYERNALTVHDCTRLYRKSGGTVYVRGHGPASGKPADELLQFNTCAARLSEALVISLELVASRAAITALTRRGGNGKSFLLGKYDYRNNLCPHGIARGARDLAYFLRDQWGNPTMSWKRTASSALSVASDPEEEHDTTFDYPTKLAGQTGVIAFIKIPGYDGQGHMDLWNKTDLRANTGSWPRYGNSQKVWFWRLD